MRICLVLSSFAIGFILNLKKKIVHMRERICKNNIQFVLIIEKVFALKYTIDSVHNK